MINKPYKKQNIKKNQDIKKIIKSFVSNINNSISIQLGQNYNLLKLNQIDYTNLANDTKELLAKNNLHLTLENPSDINDSLNILKGFSLGFFLKYYEDQSKGVSLFEFIEQELHNKFEISTSSFLNNTNFKSYKESFFKIITRIIEQKRDEVIRFLDTIPLDEITNTNQFTVTCSLEAQILEKKTKRISPELINKYIKLHESLSKLFEKKIRIAYGILKILNKETIKNESNNFKDTETIVTYKMYKYLKNDVDFKILIEPFTTLRFNAEKHIKYRKNPIKKEIIFEANDDKNNIQDKDRTMSYINFLQNTKELFAVLYLLRFRDGIRLLEIKKTNSSIQKQLAQTQSG
jgi:hypothetical protein